MHKIRLAVAALVLAPAMAGAAEARGSDELACIAATYSPTQLGEVDALLPQLDLLFQQRTPKLEQLATIIAGTHAWSDVERESAMMHEYGRLMELALRRHGLLADADFIRIDALLDMGDRTELWTLMERHLGYGLAGSKADIGQDDAVMMGRFLMETGVGPDARKTDQVSAYLAAKALQRISARNFAAQ